MENSNNFVARKAIEELVKGREFANQLRQVINGGGGGGGDDSGKSEQLVRKVLISFTNSLVILNNDPSAESHQVPSTRINPTKSEDSLESNCKSSTVKERRGCYKRRRTSQSWEKESEAPIDDGHQWRKYGQKVILNAKHPRNYYRCTHKFDQGCQATKQVQRIQDEPSPLYKTTYYGHHICRNFTMMNPEIILADDDSNDNDSHNSSVFLCFGSNNNNNNNKQNNNCTTPTFLTSSTTTIVKKECKEEIPSLSSSNDDDDYNLLSAELTFDNYSNHVTGALYDPSDFDDAFDRFFEF